MPVVNTLAAAQIGDENYKAVMTNTVLETLHNLFMGTASNGLRPTHIALGTGTTLAAPENTALSHEISRYPITQLTKSDGVITALVNLPATAADITASELGVFAGGTMISRANVELSKNSNSVLNIIWMLTIEEA